jgi:hypothetical protein
MSDATSSGPPDPARRHGRRKFLILTAGVVGVGGILAHRWVAALARRAGGSAYSHLLAIDLDPAAGIGEPTEGELTTLVRFAEVLYPSAVAEDPRLADEAAGVTRDVLERLGRQVPGKLAEFRLGAALLDGAARDAHGAPFASLTLEQRRALVDPLLRPVAEASRPMRAALCLVGYRSHWRLWHHVGKPILGGFYRSSAGWRFIGYPTRPGECSDALGYQEAPRLAS